MLRAVPRRPSDRPAPLTDPAEFMTLVGRFAAAQVLNVILLGCLVRKAWVTAAVVGIASAIVHRAMIRLYLRLRAERAAAEEARRT
jgi:hypothetical protein